MKKMQKIGKRVMVFGSVLTALAMSGMAFAASQTATLEVTGTFVDAAPAEVEISATPMSFELSTVNTLSTTYINVTAPAGLTCELLLDGGQNFANDRRYLRVAGDGVTSMLIPKWPYNLYTDNQRTRVWGDDGASTPVSWEGSVKWIGGGTPRTFPVFGRAYGQTMTDMQKNAMNNFGFTFTDSVTITVAY